MSDIVVIANPQGLPGMAAFEPLAAKLTAELRAIESLSAESRCRICGREGPLTFEHTPARSAGNRPNAVRYSVDQRRAAQGALEWRGRVMQRGIGVRSLCDACNNNTGAWFNPAYVEWIRALRHFAHPANAQKIVAVPFPEAPLLVVKQALTTLIATCQPGLTTRFPQLRALLTNSESLGTLEPIRIYAYLVASPKCLSRFSGLSWTIDTASGAGWIWAEFSHWPVGWIISIRRAEPPAGTADVSDWVTSPPGLGPRRRQIHLPCQWVIGSQPADFRPPQAFRR